MTHFLEVQRFTQPWILMIVILDVIFIWIFTFLMFTGRIADTNSLAMGITALVFVLCGIFVPLLLLSSCLKTAVRREGISIFFLPFHFKEKVFSFKDIRSIESREYRPIVEYGGWGVRMGSQGRAYNVSGNKGIQMVLNNGEKILIGTQKPEEFMQAVPKAKATS